MDVKRLELLKQIGGVFMHYGVRSINMDDIAKELKISKKTLYKYFKDKNDIVMQVMTGQCEMEKTMMSLAINSSENAIDELMNVTEVVGQQLKDVHPSVLHDLEKYYPEAWSFLTQHKETYILGCIKSNLERGVKERVYRDNLNPEIIAKLYVSKVDTVFDSKTFPAQKFTFSDVHIELMRYHIRGIANEKGLAYLKEKIKQNHSKL